MASPVVTELALSTLTAVISAIICALVENPKPAEIVSGAEVETATAEVGLTTGVAAQNEAKSAVALDTKEVPEGPPSPRTCFPAKFAFVEIGIIILLLNLLLPLRTIPRGG